MSVSVNASLKPRGDVLVVALTMFDDLGIDAFVTTRLGGASKAPYDSLNLATHVGDDPHDVRHNRQLVAQAIGVELSELIFVNQVHGNQIIGAAASSTPLEADALVTSSSDLALAMLVADCVPILLADENSDSFALVHAGWRGLKLEILRNAVRRFASPPTLRAYLGPCISPRRYQIGPDVATNFERYQDALVPDVDDRSRLDLHLVARQQLIECGVRANAIVASEYTTDDTDLFFSDRANRPCGRFALVAKRRSPHTGCNHA